MDNAEKDIIVNVKLEREDAGEMNTAYLKAMKSHRLNWFLLTIGAILIVFSFLTLFIVNIITGNTSSASVSSDTSGGFSPVMYLALIFVIIYAVYNFAMPLLVKRLGRRQYDSNKLLQKETQYTIASEGIKAESESVLLDLRYDEIFKIMETKKYIFIYESDQAARIIPKRSFAVEEDLKTATLLMKEHMPVKKYEIYKF